MRNWGVLMGPWSEPPGVPLVAQKRDPEEPDDLVGSVLICGPCESRVGPGADVVSVTARRATITIAPNAAPVAIRRRRYSFAALRRPRTRSLNHSVAVVTPGGFGESAPGAPRAGLSGLAPAEARAPLSFRRWPQPGQWYRRTPGPAGICTIPVT